MSCPEVRCLNRVYPETGGGPSVRIAGRPKRHSGPRLAVGRITAPRHSPLTEERPWSSRYISPPSPPSPSPPPCSYLVLAVLPVVGIWGPVWPDPLSAEIARQR